MPPRWQRTHTLRSARSCNTIYTSCSYRSSIGLNLSPLNPQRSIAMHPLLQNLSVQVHPSVKGVEGVRFTFQFLACLLGTGPLWYLQTGCQRMSTPPQSLNQACPKPQSGNVLDSNPLCFSPTALIYDSVCVCVCVRVCVCCVRACAFMLYALN